MRRIHPDQTRDDLIAYNLRDNGEAVTIFDQAQPYRVDKARSYVVELIARRPGKAVIRELCCGAADISGPFSFLHEVHGYDIVPAARRVALERFPKMQFTLGEIEKIRPEPCDILVLCETLEHLYDPLKLVSEWLPLADSVIIGHPLNEPEPFLEPGHCWRYDEDDYLHWFDIGGHELVKMHQFRMDPFPEMVIGYGVRKATEL